MTTKFVPALFLLAIAAFAAAGDSPSKFKITTKKKDDTVEVRAEKDKVLFVVKSPFGISQAVIERQDDAWPIGGVLCDLAVLERCSWPVWTTAHQR